VEDLNISFKNPAQQEWYFCTSRNKCFSGGFGNGKSYVACLLAVTLLTTFSNYRIVIARQTLVDLKKTTMQTFFKILPRHLIRTHDKQDGVTVLINGSVIFWMHLDSADEQSLRGLEINSVIIDQAEEISEAIYLVLDSRIGRWDQAKVPAELKTKYFEANGREWPKTRLGNDKVPTYMMPLCNPDSQFHWIYRRYHPDSLEKVPSHVMIQGETDPELNDPETIQQMLSRDPEWVAKYFKGEWGISTAQIHYLPSVCILEPTQELLDRIKKKGNLYRAFDHGDSAPSCCLWFCVLDGCFICFREYYSPNKIISEHRKSISELSENERYTASYADPSIFHKENKSNGGWWSIALEYSTPDLDSPPVHFIPADNNEFATRNRINELLKFNPIVRHPTTGDLNAPRLYFIKKTDDYPNGCYFSILQLQSQRRKLLGTDNGKPIYIDDRDENVTDHAYDPTRYFVAAHGNPAKEKRKSAPPRTFAYHKKLMELRKLRPPVAASVR
jgi:hypothetical protein